MNARTMLILSLWILGLADPILVSYGQDTGTIPEAFGPVVDSVASTDGVMIHYEVVGEGEPTLVFVHGWSCDRSYWNGQSDEFAKDYRVMTVDIGGHGESGTGRKNWTLEAFGADVAAVVNKLDPPQVILIGHSMGGGVNIQAARQLPGRVIGLIGVDTYKKFGTGYPQEKVDEITTSFKEDFATSMDEFVRNFFPENADSTLVNWVVADMSAAPPEVAISAMASFFTSNPQKALKEVRVPIRAINCDRWPTDLETNRIHAASFELKLMPGTGHFNMMEDPVTFNGLLRETLFELIGNRQDFPSDLH